MKTCLGARTRSKNPRRRVQNAPKHGRMFGVQKHHSALLECRTALKRAEFPPFGLWPKTL